MTEFLFVGALVALVSVIFVSVVFTCVPGGDHKRDGQIADALLAWVAAARRFASVRPFTTASPAPAEDEPYAHHDDQPTGFIRFDGELTEAQMTELGERFLAAVADGLPAAMACEPLYPVADDPRWPHLDDPWNGDNTYGFGLTITEAGQ